MAEEIFSRDYNAKKRGFPNLGLTFIYTSLQQAPYWNPSRLPPLAGLLLQSTSSNQDF
jgi:hypothetical protein